MAYPVVAPAPAYLWRLTDATATVGTGFVEYFGSTNLALTHSSGSGVTHSPSIILNGTYSYEFGFQDDLQTPNGSPGSANSAFSISFFYKNTSTDPSGTTYLAQGNAAIPANTGWSLSMKAGAVLKLIVGTGSAYSTLTTTAAIPLNTTTYITVTYDGAGNWAVNQNGLNKGTLASAVLSPIVASPFVSIGSEGYAWNVSGYLQDIRVWNSALTIQQDASCYALATMSGPVVVQSNPNQYTTSSTRYATLNSPPSSGSTLFASIRATGNAVTPSGWTSIYLSGGRGLCWKVSNGTETSVQMDSINGTGVTAMMEVAGGNSGSMVVGTNATSSGGTTGTANVSVPATNGGVVFSFVASQAAATYTVSDAAPSGQVNFLVNSVVALDSSSNYDAIYIWMTTSEPSAASQPYTDNFTFTTTMVSQDQILIWIPASPVQNPPKLLRTSSIAVGRASFY